MRLIIIFLLTFIVLSIRVSGQTRRVLTPAEQVRIQIAEQRRISSEFERLRNIGEHSRDSNSEARQQQLAIQNLDLLYRQSTDKELKLLAPDKEDQETFGVFLRQRDTGLIKLVEDAGCSENSAVVSASGPCVIYTMPGAGSSFSFRKNDYRIPRLSDLTFIDNSFQAMGNLVHAIFVNLGDVPLEEVNMQTKGLEFLAGFKPETDFQKAREIGEKLVNGIDVNGYKYRRGVRAVNNNTYVLRSVAYRGKFHRAVPGLTYNELDYDKRLDVIVAFRTVRRHPDGSVTLLWKQLAKQTAPKTKWLLKSSTTPSAK